MRNKRTQPKLTALTQRVCTMLGFGKKERIVSLRKVGVPGLVK